MNQYQIDIIKLATTQLGVAETANFENPSILKYFDAFTLEQSLVTQTTPWCSIFLNWVMWQLGLSRSRNVTARSWLQCGIEVEFPDIGDIAVFWRESAKSEKGHVGIYFAETDEQILILAGNQSDKVSFKWLDKSRLLGFRSMVQRSYLHDVELTEETSFHKIIK